jgi:hypothetical protein
MVAWRKILARPDPPDPAQPGKGAESPAGAQPSRHTGPGEEAARERCGRGAGAAQPGSAGRPALPGQRGTGPHRGLLKIGPAGRRGWRPGSGWPRGPAGERRGAGQGAQAGHQPGRHSGPAGFVHYSGQDLYILAQPSYMPDWA